MILVQKFCNKKLQDQKHLKTTGPEVKISQTVESECHSFCPSSSPSICVTLGIPVPPLKPPFPHQGNGIILVLPPMSVC